MVQKQKDVCRALYCITPALDGYFLHSDRIPCTQMMMSPNICGTVLYDLWHPCSHPSLLLLFDHLLQYDLLPSKPTYVRDTSSADFHKLSHHPCVSQHQPNLWSL